MSNKDAALSNAFDPESFRRMGHKVVDLLAEHLAASLDGSLETVLPPIDPEAMLDRWPGVFPREPSGDYQALIRRVIADSNNLQHPRYIGHQCCTTLPLAALNDLVGSFLNNGSAIYEMGPANSAMEKRLVQWMGRLIGYGDRSDGVFTHGGTVGNLTALLAARQCKAGHDVWKHGVRSEEPMTVLVSTECHYSVKRAVGVMGLGEDAVAPVPVDDRFHIDLEAAGRMIAEEKRKGRKAAVIVANSCSTATGNYDDLEAIADFAEAHDLWFHVDGAHGASALLSDKYRHLLKGLSRADSMIWDAHKMLMTPALATAVLFKNGGHSFEAFSQKASYLFEKEAREEWYNYAQRTIECTKSMMGMRLYVALAALGTDLFANFVTATYDLAREFAGVIDHEPDFELAAPPESNIVCFRYVQPGVNDPDALQKKIRREIVESGKFYIVQTALPQGFFLRCTLINPNTTLGDLTDLVALIRRNA